MDGVEPTLISRTAMPSAQPLGEPDHHAALLLRNARRLASVGGPVGVAGMAQDAFEREAPLSGELPGDFERVGRGRVHARAVVAAVHFEPDAKAGARKRAGR